MLLKKPKKKLKATKRNCFKKFQKVALPEKDIGGNISKLKDKEKDTINKVVKFYGKYDNQQLSDITHSEKPWKNARKGLAPSDRGENVITLESMNDYYLSLK